MLSHLHRERILELNYKLPMTRFWSARLYLALEILDISFDIRGQRKNRGLSFDEYHTGIRPTQSLPFMTMDVG
jgi:hypothetical protein